MTQQNIPTWSHFDTANSNAYRHTTPCYDKDAFYLDRGGKANAVKDNQPTIVKGKWPCWTGKSWTQKEDHRKREDYPDLVAQFGEGYPQEATEFWLPDDTHETPSRTMKDIGPLPEGALLKRPALAEPTQEERNVQRHTEILARLSEIDFESVRPLRAIVEDKATQDDKSKLTALEAEAELLRVELATIPK